MNGQAAFSRRNDTTMCTKAMIGLAAAIVLGAAATVPAISASSKVRVARPAHVPAPSYGTWKDGRGHFGNPAHDVYVHGRYSGSDPDPRIRTDLARDPPWGSYS